MKIKIVLLLLLAGNLYAQAPKKWSLEECIQHAVAHNIDIKKTALQKEQAEVDLNTAKMSRLPDLNAGMGQQWNFGRSNKTLLGIYENQTASNSNFYISSSIPLFTGFKIPNQIAQNKLQLEAVAYNLEKAKEDLSLNVAALFLQVLFNKEILKVSEEQSTLSQLQVKKTETLVEIGKVPASQLYDIKAQAAKDEVDVTESKNRLQLSLLDLAQCLELEHISDFDIAAPGADNAIENNMNGILPPENIYAQAVTVKPQIKEQETLVQSAEKALKIAQSGYYPSLNLEMGYGTSYYYNYTMQGKTAIDATGQPYTWYNEAFGRQFKNNMGEYIGLSLTIPIFNRFAVRNQVKNARLNIQDRQLTLENTKKKLYKEIQTARLDAVAAQAKYISSKKAVEASREAFKYAEERYEIGKSTVYEFNESKARLFNSLSEQIKAEYDYIFRCKILDFYTGIPIKL